MMQLNIRRFSGNTAELNAALEKMFPLNTTHPREILEYLHQFDHKLKVPVLTGIFVYNETLVCRTPAAPPPTNIFDRLLSLVFPIESMWIIRFRFSGLLMSDSTGILQYPDGLLEIKSGQMPPLKGAYLEKIAVSHGSFGI